MTTLTDSQKQLVSESFNRVASIADKAAELFYKRLWEISPDTRPLFKSTDMKEQGKKLMQTLAIAVASLNKPEKLSPILIELGNRHLDYGVKPEHYDAVGEALIWTLAQALDKDFTSETKEAWLTVYNLLATTMKSHYTQHNSDVRD